MHPATERFIEQMGLLWAKEGYARIAGRIFAFALLSPRPCSLDEIAAALKVSKPSVSNDARMLHRLGVIERIGIPGDRKDYYQLTRDSIERSMETRLLRMEAFQKVIASASSLPITNADVKRRIEAHILANRAVIAALRKVTTTLQASRRSAQLRRRHRISRK